MVMVKGGTEFNPKQHEKVTQPAQESVLQEAQRLINGDRNESYGHCLDDYNRTAALFNAAFAHKLSAPLSAEDLMLTMILVKISRVVHKPKRDSIVDIAGYAGCLEKAEQERARRSEIKDQIASPDKVWHYQPPSGVVQYSEIKGGVYPPVTKRK